MRSLKQYKKIHLNDLKVGEWYKLTSKRFNVYIFKFSGFTDVRDCRYIGKSESYCISSIIYGDYNAPYLCMDTEVEEIHRAKDSEVKLYFPDVEI